MGNSSVRRLILECTITLGGGILSSLIAFLARAHPVVILSIGVSACALTAILVTTPRRKRVPIELQIKGTPCWENLNSVFRVVAIRIEVSNRTGDPVRIEGFELTYEVCNGTLDNARLSDDDAATVKKMARSGRYYPPLPDHVEILAHTSICGWYIAPVIRDPIGGTPKCIIRAIDAIGNRYKTAIPARESHVY
jgi:hypothetical protein